VYSDRYWEMFNEIDGDFDHMAIRTFKVGLPTEHGLRKSLTGKPATSVRKLMERIDKYKRVEEDQQQGKGKGKAISQERRILGRTDTTITDPRRILLGSLGPRLPRRLTWCSENHCIKSWTRTRTSHTSNGQQNGRRPLEEQLEPPLPISPGAGAYH